MKPAILRALLIVTLLVAQLGTVAVFTLDASRRVTDELERNARTTLIALAGTVAGQTTRYLRSNEAVLSTAGDMIALGVLDPEDDVTIERLFLAQLGSDERLRALYVGRSDGSFLVVSRRTGGPLSTMRVESRTTGKKGTTTRFHEDEFGRTRRLADPASDYDPRTRPWYELAHAAPGVGWTTPYLFYPSGLPGISAALAVRDPSGKPAGVVGLDIDIRTLSDFMERVPGADRDTAVLLDERHHVIASSRPEWLALARHSGRLPLLEEVSGGPLSAIAERFDEASAIDGESVLARVELADREYLGLARPLYPDGVSSPWQLLVQVPVDDYIGTLAGYLDQRSSWLLGALAVLSLLALRRRLRWRTRVGR